MSTLSDWSDVINKIGKEERRKEAEFQAKVDRYGDLLQLTSDEPVYAVKALIQYFDKEIEELRDQLETSPSNHVSLDLLRMKYLLLRQQCLSLYYSMETTL